MSQVAFHAMAALEMKEIYSWYEERDPETAVRFNDSVNDAVERLRQDPESQPIEFKRYRWVRVRRFPYRLLFEQLDQDRVLILAVAHTSRDPRYWQDRI